MNDNNKSLESFHAAAAAYILGKSTGIKLQGSQERIKATRNILEASKDLYQELNSPDTSLQKVSGLLEAKRNASTLFTQVTGINWIL